MNKKINILVPPLIVIFLSLYFLSCPALSYAQKEESKAEEKFIVEEADKPQPIIIEKIAEELEKRMDRKITLDVRDMNIADVIKFLAMKGNFNVVTSPTVQGRISLLLKSVSIKDALDIALISNRLAYKFQNEIIHVMTEAEYEAIYGKSFSDKRELVILHLNYAKPSYILAALDSIKSNIGKIIIDEDTGSVVLIDTPASLQAMKEAIVDLEKPLETYTYILQYAEADVVAEKLRSRLEGNKVGTILADERSNQLIVRAIAGRRAEIEGLIKTLDAKTLEVLINVRVLQITFKPQYDIGIDWDLDFLDSADGEIRKITFKNVFLNQSGLSSGDNLFKHYGRMAIGNIDEDHFQTAIRALKQVSDTKILQNPQLLVTNNQEAKIHIGDTVPYIISTTSGTGDNAITSEDVRFVDVGLKINVTPTINPDGFVTMRLQPEISTVTTRIESAGGGIPQVNKTLLETTVMVKDGNTVVLGGLKKEDKVHVKREIPFLGSIPFLGRFFSSTSDTITKTEIVIFITPRIVTGEETFDDLRGDIKPFKEYNALNGQGYIKPLAP